MKAKGQKEGKFRTSPFGIVHEKGNTWGPPWGPGHQAHAEPASFPCHQCCQCCLHRTACAPVTFRCHPIMRHTGIGHTGIGHTSMCDTSGHLHAWEYANSLSTLDEWQPHHRHAH